MNYDDSNNVKRDYLEYGFLYDDVHLLLIMETLLHRLEHG
jgi:hypothetical protein